MAYENDTLVPREDLSLEGQPIDGDAAGKNLLSMYQVNERDIADYIEEAQAAETLVRDPARRGAAVLPFTVLKVVMQQASTRTGGSMTTAIQKLGGSADLYSGMASSSEAKGETPDDTWVAFATQSDLIGTRTPNVGGPLLAARAIGRSYEYGKLWQKVPVINLGDGTNEHPTQALGDLFTIYKNLREFRGKTLAVVGDQERYRAFHSLLIGAATLGMNVVAVESVVAKVPDELVSLLGSGLSRTHDLDSAMRDSDILYVGRNPDEYTGNKPEEIERSRQLAADYAKWIINKERLQQMSPRAIVMHPRPRRDELHTSVDDDLRMVDVGEMADLIPMRMSIVARHGGASIKDIVQAA